MQGPDIPRVLLTGPRPIVEQRPTVRVLSIDWTVRDQFIQATCLKQGETICSSKDHKMSF